MQVVGVLSQLTLCWPLPSMLRVHLEGLRSRPCHARVAFGFEKRWSLNNYLHGLLLIMLTFCSYILFNPEFVTLYLSIGPLFFEWVFTFLLSFIGHRFRVRQKSQGQDLDTVWHARVPGPGDHPQQGTGCCQHTRAGACGPSSYRFQPTRAWSLSGSLPGAAHTSLSCVSFDLSPDEAEWQPSVQKACSRPGPLVSSSCLKLTT